MTRPVFDSIALPISRWLQDEQDRERSKQEVRALAREADLGRLVSNIRDIITDLLIWRQQTNAQLERIEARLPSTERTT